MISILAVWQALSFIFWYNLSIKSSILFIAARNSDSKSIISSMGDISRCLLFRKSSSLSSNNTCTFDIPVPYMALSLFVCWSIVTAIVSFSLVHQNIEKSPNFDLNNKPSSISATDRYCSHSVLGRPVLLNTMVPNDASWWPSRSSFIISSPILLTFVLCSDDSSFEISAVDL